MKQAYGYCREEGRVGERTEEGDFVLAIYYVVTLFGRQSFLLNSRVYDEGATFDCIPIRYKRVSVSQPDCKNFQTQHRQADLPTPNPQ